MPNVAGTCKHRGTLLVAEGVHVRCAFLQRPCRRAEPDQSPLFCCSRGSSSGSGPPSHAIQRLRLNAGAAVAVAAADTAALVRMEGPEHGGTAPERFGTDERSGVRRGNCPEHRRRVQMHQCKPRTAQWRGQRNGPGAQSRRRRPQGRGQQQAAQIGGQLGFRLGAQIAVTVARQPQQQAASVITRMHHRDGNWLCCSCQTATRICGLHVSGSAFKCLSL